MASPLRGGLFGEIVSMALVTLREHKLRSGLTVLGIAIGIMSIVGMTSLIRGLDKSLRESILAMGSDTIMVAKFGGFSLGSGRELTELLRRPNLTPDDAEAIASQAPSLASVNIVLGQGGPPTRERVYYRSERSKLLNVFGSTANYAEVFHIDVVAGRFFTPGETRRRAPVIVLGQTPVQALFPNLDPIGRRVRLGQARYTVIGVLGPTPSPGGFNMGQDDLVVIPHTSYQKQFGIRAERMFGGEMRAVMIAAIPRDDVDRDVALADIERVMRIRHRLRLDEANDFELMTQDAILALWAQISGAIFLTLIVVSSIALMVGGIGVMAIMTISVTERTREIGTRRALGAKRKEILWQFLLEASFLTAVGGVIGILLGSGIGVGVHFATGFPISLPWWVFALGIGFSASVGIMFGLFPAIKASNLDPIEALRHE
ncbi:MAG TPA: FtsX-like permease family protein [Acidobacteria bacterium]|nr:FtsX-like permease family protein [Acidobacteriota bacterium]HIN11923.1 FtsX-like permease family protein [Acidobacteriota bacterium]